LISSTVLRTRLSAWRCASESRPAISWNDCVSSSAVFSTSARATADVGASARRENDPNNSVSRPSIDCPVVPMPASTTCRISVSSLARPSVGTSSSTRRSSRRSRIERMPVTSTPLPALSELSGLTAAKSIVRRA